MKNVIIIFLILINFKTQAQKSHKILFDSGQVKEVGQYDENDKPTGEWKRFYETGNLKEILNYNRGNLIGEWKFYRENGNFIERMENCLILFI